MSSNIAIKLSDISKVYNTYDKPSDRLKQATFPRARRLFKLKKVAYNREFWALRSISFEVKKGETLGIIGKNGAGKSTLLQIICGTLNSTSGQCETKGRVAALLELGSGFDPEFTGRENVYMNASILGLKRQEIDNKFEAITKFADIGDFVDQPVKTYSSGMILRLAFAVIAHVDADVLIIDEALAVGDAFFVQKCMRYLRKFMKTGTVLFVSHDISAVMNLCDRAIFLKNGEIFESGAPKNIVKKYLADLYNGNEFVQEKRENTEIYGTGSVSSKAPTNIDMRETLYNNSNLRNDIEIFTFNPESEYFGTGGATITSARLVNTSGVPFDWVVGGNDVMLEIKCKANSDISRPIIGFEFRDRLGQVVFSDNTFLVYEKIPFPVQKGAIFLAKFSFKMPILPTGDYSVTTAIADGTQEEHIQLNWKHEALIVRVHASSICLGVFGVAMQNISMEESEE